MKHEEPTAPGQPDTPGAPDAPSSLGSRRRILTWVVAGAVVLTTAGIVVATTIRSPAQVAADAAPPPASVLADRVERRVLTSSVVVRGTVTAEQTLTVTPGAGAGAAGAKPVVTRVNKQPGTSVQAGEVLLEVSGRPVFALAGALPVYRDLKPGATGKDVGQLQQGLKALGHSTGADPAGTYGSGTKAAVTAFYTALGYAPRPSDPADAENVRVAEDAADAAARQVTTAKNALKKAKEGGSGGGGGGGAGGDASEAQLQLSFAQQDLAKAKSRLDAARAAAGPMVPADELLFVKGFPARVDAVKASVGQPVPEALLSVSAGAPVVRASLPAHQKDLVKPGMKVQLLSEATGLSATATVEAVAADPTPAAAGPAPAGGGSGQAAPDSPQNPGGYALTVTPDQALDPQLTGQGVRLTVTAASSGEPVLIVPLSAVSAGADGRTTVTVLGKDPQAQGDRRRVEVRAGMSADGMVQVDPIGGGALADGDRVLVAQAKP